MEINENKLKEILDGQRDAFQRHVDTHTVKQREEFQHFFGIMKEDFDSKLELIGEQYGTIREMIGSLAEDMQIVKSDIEFVKGALRKKVDYDEFQALEKRVAMLEAKATRK
jgi:hypothetical protein